MAGRCAKIFLLIFNTLFWFSSIIIFILGVYYLLQDERSSLFILFSSPRHNYALIQLLAWILVFIGTVTFLMALCGCFAVIENNRCILFIYVLLLMLTFALELTVGLLAIIFQEKIFSVQSTSNLVDRLRNEYGIQSSFTAAIDLAQTKFECCGIESPLDYEKSYWFIEQQNMAEMLQVSRTCCKLSNQMEPQAYLNPKPINESLCQSNLKHKNQFYRNQKGCLQLVEKFIRSECKMFIILGIGLAKFALTGIVISICFCHSLRLKT